MGIEPIWISCLQGRRPPHADPSPIELSFGYHPSTATISPSSIFECGLLALRLLHFDEFHTSSSVNMRNATAVLVGPSNFPLFGPQGKHHGFEDYLVIDFRLRNLQFRVVAAPTLIAYGFTHHKKHNLRYDLTTLHTWVMVLEVGLEPTRLAAADFESAKSTNSIIQAYKRTLGAAVSPAASPTINLGFRKDFSRYNPTP